LHLVLRHDNGSQYISDRFQDERSFLGIESSPSFVWEPEGERLRRALHSHAKEQLLWIRWFDTVEDLRFALLEFRRTYNARWLIERHGFRSPAHVRLD